MEQDETDMLTAHVSPLVSLLNEHQCQNVENGSHFQQQTYLHQRTVENDLNSTYTVVVRKNITSKATSHSDHQQQLWVKLTTQHQVVGNILKHPASYYTKQES